MDRVLVLIEVNGEADVLRLKPLDYELLDINEDEPVNILAYGKLGFIEVI